MLRFIYLICISALLIGCSNKNNDPAANAPAVQIPIVRFDDAFFNMDTNQMAVGIKALYDKYPLFSNDFFGNILMLNPLKDTIAIKAFYRGYRPIYDQAKQLNGPLKVQLELNEAFKRFHFYFPSYKLPPALIYFIGPLESYGNIITHAGVAVGLQMYLGSQSPWYFSEQIQTIYPVYMSRRFEVPYIPVVAIQNMLSDYVPNNALGKNVLTQMIESGKRQYILEKCCPTLADSLVWGYTQQQLNALKIEEANIWTFLLQQKLIYSTEQVDMRNMLQEAAYNDYFGEEIPGDVGRYIGYQIVYAWIQKQPKKERGNLDALLKIPAQALFDAAGYQQ